MVQWLRLHTSTEGAQVEHLVSELKSHLPCAVAKNFKTNKLQKKKTNKQTILHFIWFGKKKRFYYLALLNIFTIQKINSV